MIISSAGSVVVWKQHDWSRVKTGDCTVKLGFEGHLPYAATVREPGPVAATEPGCSAGVACLAAAAEEVAATSFCTALGLHVGQAVL